MINSDDYRIFCGDLGNEVHDEMLKNAFSRYASLQRVRVVRDKKSGKSKGFGFVSFSDPHDFINALREMNGTFLFLSFLLSHSLSFSLPFSFFLQFLFFPIRFSFFFFS